MADIRKTMRTELSDSATLARFIANPKAVAAELGTDLKDEKIVRDLERLAANGQAALNGIGRAAGLAMKEADWGIGAGCCNSKAIALPAFRG